MSVRSRNPTNSSQTPSYNQVLVNEALGYVGLVANIKKVCLNPNEQSRCDTLSKHLYSLLDTITVPNSRIVVKRLKKEAIEESVAVLFYCMSPESYARAKVVLDDWMLRYQ